MLQYLIKLEKILIKGIPPTIKQLYYASNILKDKIIKELKPIQQKLILVKLE